LRPKYGKVCSDYHEEAERIIRASKQEGVLLRLLGALAFSTHCPKFAHLQQILGRTFSDIDFASYRSESREIIRLFADLGYQEDFMVTRLYGASRLVFDEHGHNSRHCDVFLDKLDFCHEISFQNRLEVDDPTVPLAELLLEKMQIVKLNEKDVIDTIMLLREHQIGDSDKETINSDHIAYLCSRNWGLWKTVTSNLGRVEQLIPSFHDLSSEDRADINHKIQKLLTRIADEHKTTNWKLRARIGEKRRWYKDVEELAEM